MYVLRIFFFFLSIVMGVSTCKLVNFYGNSCCNFVWACIGAIDRFKESWHIKILNIPIHKHDIYLHIFKSGVTKHFLIETLYAFSAKLQNQRYYVSTYTKEKTNFYKNFADKFQNILILEYDFSTVGIY